MWGQNTVDTGPAIYDPSSQDAAPPLEPLRLVSDIAWSFTLDSDGNPDMARGTQYKNTCCQTGLTGLCFKGQAGADTTAPVYKVAAPEFLPGVVLPFAVPALAASEGVDPDDWIAHVTATLDGAPVALEGVPM